MFACVAPRGNNLEMSRWIILERHFEEIASGHRAAATAQRAATRSPVRSGTTPSNLSRVHDAADADVHVTD